MSHAVVHPPETIEGWYALHQVFAIDRPALRALPQETLPALRERLCAALTEIAHPAEGGWSAVVPLVGGTADVMLVHFRPSLEELATARQRIAREPLADVLRPIYGFLSVTELGLYHVTAQLAREAEARGGQVGDEEYRRQLAERVAAEREGAHGKRRLYPQPPAEMPYVCFYPMSKRRAPEQNWYALTLDERSRLMYTHGLTGRRYAGKVVQVITGAIGFDAWEWGVTLFARDPLDFKRLVTDMRFDEVSAQYAEFGDFHVGKLAPVEDWVATLG